MCKQNELRFNKVLMSLASIALFFASSQIEAKTKARRPASELSVESNSGDAGPRAEKVDTSDLEKGYWATKDQDMAVIQNRLYSKAHKIMLSLAYGPILNNSYSEGTARTAMAHYYWSERYGVQLTYQGFETKNNKLTDALIVNNGQVPDFNKPISYYGASFNWVPIYAKMSLLEQKVMYFDMAFSPSAGMTTYESQISSGNKSYQTFTYGFDITQHFFVSQHWAFRVDYTNRWYTEKKYDYVDATNPNNTGKELSEDFIHASQLMLGISFYFH